MYARAAQAQADTGGGRRSGTQASRERSGPLIHQVVDLKKLDYQSASLVNLPRGSALAPPPLAPPPRQLLCGARFSRRQTDFSLVSSTTPRFRLPSAARPAPFKCQCLTCLPPAPLSSGASSKAGNRKQRDHYNSKLLYRCRNAARDESRVQLGGAGRERRGR